MDTVRGLAILAMLEHHIVSASLRWATDPPPEALVVADAAFAPFRMPVLMLLSGMLLSRSLSKPAGRYFSGKLANVGWPYLLWSLTILAVLGIFTVENLFRILVIPPTGLWYLWFLLAFYAIAFMIRRLPFLPIAALSLAVSAFAVESARIDRFLFLFAFFLLGDWMTRNSDAVGRGIARRWVPWAAGAVAAGTVAAAIAGLTIRYQPWSAPGVVAVTVLAMRYLPRADSARWLDPVRYVGRNSIVFYVAHWPVMAGTALVIIAVWGAPGSILLSTIVAVVGLGASAALAWARPRSRMIDFLFAWPKRSRERKSQRAIQASGADR